MHLPAALFLLVLTIAGCSSRGAGPAGPGSATPAAEPGNRPAVASTDDAGHRPARPDNAGPQRVPVRADQAPLVQVREALVVDSLMGRRVRVTGRCAERGEGRMAGSWIMDQDGATIEVRGLVPSSCAEHAAEPLTIFAQIEPKAAGSEDRILLRLPD